MSEQQRMIHLRSDTVTKPSVNMRVAMANAVVGDDVYGEDPTVNKLEARAAEIFGKEAALFVPTGTMGNTIAVKIHTNHGEEVICDSRSHLLDWELSMMAWFSGCLVRAVPTSDGILTWKSIAGALRPKGPHNAPTTLIELENTHNMSGGTVYPQETIDEICAEAHALGLKVHIDGARIFNAATAGQTSVARIARDVDSVMFCLRKAWARRLGVCWWRRARRSTVRVYTASVWRRDAPGGCVGSSGIDGFGGIAGGFSNRPFECALFGRAFE